MTGHRPLQLGMVSHHGEDWIAGVLYVQTVIHALTALPEAVRPDMHLWLRRGKDPSLYDRFAEVVRSSNTYDALCHESFRGALKFHRRSLIRHGRLSRSLAELATGSAMDVLFPCHESLGPDSPVPWVGWIPDFQHLHLPELFSDAALAKRDQIHARMLRESSHMVVSSEDALRDLLGKHEVVPDKVSVYRFRTHAQQAWFDADPQGVARKHGLPEKFLMFPSQFWQHKNHLTLFEALVRLRDRGLKPFLVLTGMDRDDRNPSHVAMLRDFLNQHQLQEQVRHLGILPRDEQIQLMRRSVAVVQPSRFEGWSMLVEDCRALGKVVILSDIAVHKEQAYSMAHYFPVGDASALAEVIEGLWGGLEPGPDLENEKQAREENARLTLESGRMLLEMFEKVRSGRPAGGH